MVRPPSLDPALIRQIIDGTHHETKSSSSARQKKKSHESKMNESDKAGKKKKKTSKVSRKKKFTKKKSKRRDPNFHVEEEQRRMELNSEPNLDEKMSNLLIEEENIEETWNESMFRLTFFTFLNFYFNEVPETKSFPEYTFFNAKVISRTNYVIPPVGSISQLPLVSLFCRKYWAFNIILDIKRG